MAEKYISKIVNANGDEFYFNASQINGHTVESNIPADAVLTDTTYQIFTLETDGEKGGLVPIPTNISQGDEENFFLTANGTWRNIDGDFTVESDLKYVKDFDNNNQKGVIIGDIDSNQARGGYSVAVGEGVQTEKPCCLAIGKYNQTGTFGERFIVGNGTNEDNRKTVFVVLDSGDIYMNLQQNIQTDFLYAAIPVDWRSQVCQNIY